MYVYDPLAPRRGDALLNAHGTQCKVTYVMSNQKISEEGECLGTRLGLLRVRVYVTAELLFPGRFEGGGESSLETRLNRVFFPSLYLSLPLSVTSSVCSNHTLT